MNLDRIITAADAISTAKKGGRSQLYGWYWERYTDLAPVLLPPRLPNWDRIAEEFAALSAEGEPVNDGNGKPPTPATCRKTFAKIVRDKDLMKSETHSRRNRRGATSVAAPSPKSNNPAPFQAGTHAGNEADDDFELKLAGGLKDWTKNKETDDD